MNALSPLRTEISRLWHQVNREMRSLLDDAFRESAMPPPVYFMLREIVREPGITVSELSRRVAMVKSHVSRTVDHMADRGYVRKESDPADQRLIRLYATAPAERELEQTNRRVCAAWQSLVADMSAEELAAVEQGLRILLKTLERNATTRPREKV